MSDGADDLRKLEVDATQAGPDAMPNLEKAVGVAVAKGRKAWQDAIRGRRYLKAYAPSIDYDRVRIGADGITTELGPNLDRNVGAPGLGIVEDSPGGVRGTPQRNYIAAEEVMGPDLEKGVLMAIDDALRKNGL